MHIEEQNILFYHKDCTDGFGAAYSFWKKFGKTMKYIPISHYELFEDIDVTNKNVYFADIAPVHPPSIMKVNEMAKIAKSIVILDHHKTAFEFYKDKPYFIYNVNKSGAKLAWEYNFPNQKSFLIDCIEDRDIWKWQIENSKYILNVLDVFSFSFEEWLNFERRLYNDKENNYSSIINEGILIQRNNEKNMERIEKNAHELSIRGTKCIAVNSPVFKSEIGMRLADKYFGEYDYVAIYSYSNNNEIVFSLRSKNDLPSEEIFDVTKVASIFGGGGHKTAAGFTINSMSDL